MDRTHVVANLSVPAVVFQTMIARHAQKIQSVPTARETTVHTRESVHGGNLKKQLQQVRVHNRLSFPEARKLVEMAAPTVADKSYAAAATPKRATKSVVINTELTWHFSEAKYKKLSDIEKTEKQLQKAAKKQKQKTENKETSTVSLDSKHPSSRSSTGLPGTDKDTRKTNTTSDRLKKGSTASPDQQ